MVPAKVMGRHLVAWAWTSTLLKGRGFGSLHHTSFSLFSPFLHYIKKAFTSHPQVCKPMIEFPGKLQPCWVPTIQGKCIRELFQDPGVLQSSHSTHRSLIVQQSVLITHTVYVREGLIGFMPLWWIHFPLKDDTQAYITCLIKNKILQPTICSLPWAHTTYIMTLPLSQLIAYSPTSLSLYMAAYGLGR